MNGNLSRLQMRKCLKIVITSGEKKVYWSAVQIILIPE